MSDPQNYRQAYFEVAELRVKAERQIRDLERQNTDLRSQLTTAQERIKELEQRNAKLVEMVKRLWYHFDGESMSPFCDGCNELRAEIKKVI